ncbi:YebC/PmpR family DNA-binding transcriptional regulator [Entomospira culicis]|uniref:Probable transcriptional regulatory protein HCT48_02230 n=1 Tax=Entomospira culicis TaxID=2719989 RepID=A0A968GFU6_9SPIO|nr:YebC/PmpR family DNA-binding transcriptional regulator [Entomospira culicis]NIZ18816.1 YebC/PmpR family DNA-binding transcriptional regulator [Entomospira culicis]NIZ69031.1 YebC/PmpR family DNA-binding transcriptional regulator [Entomospira culicis]WDI37620.1 YebC/PmpR family DNA-binding transcriptional regulator [Entomospira culicis]WDI39248.1 YebC/PmpR family DNA-binding transcriptional regulator [Entomospira culicis]
MSGHSKWSTIKHKKGAADAKRGKIFTKIIKEIVIAAKDGADVESNAKLRTAVLKARAANMPKDNIEKAIKKGSGEAGGADYVELVYEGYASGGVGLIIETLSDNKNRTAANVKSILTKAGGQMATTGAVSYQFKRMGVVLFAKDKVDADMLEELAIEMGAEDVQVESESIEVLIEPSGFGAFLDALEARAIPTLNAEISMISDQKVMLDKEKTLKVLQLIDKLEDDDDVQTVFSNLAIDPSMDLG